VRTALVQEGKNMQLDQLFSANQRIGVLSGKDDTLRRIAHMKTIDDLLFEATMEAEFGKEPSNREMGLSSKTMPLDN
jgi:hypothetical protein